MIWAYILAFIVVVAGFSAFFGAPYVPTRRRDVQKLFTHSFKLTNRDCVLDLGCGDGLVLREVRRYGARAVGYEIHPVLYGIARFLSRHDPSVIVRLVNMWTTQFPEDTTVVYVFSVGRDSKRLEALIQREANRLARPLRLICYGNPLPNTNLDVQHGPYSTYRFYPLHPHTAYV